MVSQLKLLIKSNIKTFISILVLIMLGVGFFVGMKVAVPNLRKIVNDYYRVHNFYDISLTSTIGFTKDELEELESIDGIELMAGSYQQDVLINKNKDEYVLRLHSHDLKEINNLEFILGDYPHGEDEIAIEEKMAIDLGYKIDDEIEFSNKNLKSEKYKIVAIIKSPLYLSNNKGETNLLSGKVNYYAYVHEDCFNKTNYDNAYIRISKGEKEDQVLEKIRTEGNEIIEERYKSTIESINEQITEKEKELETKKQEFADEMKKNQEQIENAELQLDSLDQSIPTEEEAQRILNEKKSKLKEVENKLNSAKAQIEASEREYNEAKREYDEELAPYASQINEYKSIIEEGEKQLQKLRNELVRTSDSARINEINQEISEISSQVGFAKSFYNAILVQIDYYQKKLDSAKAALDNAKKEYNTSKAEYDKWVNQLNASSPAEIIENAKREVEENRKILEEKKQELENARVEIQKQLDDYQNQLDDAKDYLKLISTSSWKAETLKESRSYNQFLNDIKRIENISNFFPIIFFIVAILVTLTNTTRIVENDREKIGLLKALGYSQKSISDTYYKFALIATLIGALLGCLLGFLIIPSIFYKIYLIIYQLPKYHLYFNLLLPLLATVISCLLILFSVHMSIKNTIKLKPVTLLRPVEAENGKRVFLERIPFIWNICTFTSKVTMRNLFKYPKRFFMTIIGITGCIGLIVSGLNLRSSISNIIPMQYGNIFDVDVQIFLRDSLTRGEIEEERERIDNLEEINTSILAYLKYAYINDTDNRLYLVVPEDNNLLSDFVTLKNGKQKIELEDKAIISRKIAKILNVKEGDTIKVKDSDNNVFEIEISNITDNYVDNYLYVSKAKYNELTKQNVKYNCLLARTNDIEYEEAELSQKINLNNSISYLTYTSTAKVIYDQIIMSLNYIVYVLVISAIVLAFIVLYNLNSLNVFERKREIATLKVLGFRRRETYHYIENEIKILITIGIIFGVLFGYVFSNILIKSCELNNLMYDYRINYKNYLYAIIITIVFLIITSLMSRKSINKIDMVESLKKNE